MQNSSNQVRKAYQITFFPSHLATHNFSVSFGVSLHCYNRTAVSQLILAVLVFAGPHQHSLLSSAKPHDAATCYPLAGGYLFPLAMGSSECVEAVSGQCQGHPGAAGYKANDRFKLSSLEIWKVWNPEAQPFALLLIFTVLLFRLFLSHCYAFKKP